MLQCSAGLTGIDCLQESQLFLQWVPPSRDVVASMQPMPVLLSSKKFGKTTAGDTHAMQTATFHAEVGPGTWCSLHPASLT